MRRTAQKTLTPAQWAAVHKHNGQEVRYTKGGHPYAVLRKSVMKKGRIKR